MNSSRSMSPGCVGERRRGRRLVATTPTLAPGLLWARGLVIVCDFNFVGIRCFPVKTYPVLIVDPDAAQSSPVAAQMFQAITGWVSQLTEIPNPIYLVELTPGGCPKGPRARAAGSRAVHTIKEIFGSSITERRYHGQYYIAYRYSQESLFTAPRFGF